MPPGSSSERTRRLILSRLGFWLWRLRRLPLAAVAGVRVERLDETGAVVGLAGGWRTRNPFGSTYFAAQSMAAEMSTGAPLLTLVAAAPEPLTVLVVGLEAQFVKKLLGPGLFTFSDGAVLRAAVDRVVAGGEAERVAVRSVGRDAHGDVVSEWTIHWIVKKRGDQRGRV
jgi:Domain of unknown function (DUF4442)